MTSPSPSPRSPSPPATAGDESATVDAETEVASRDDGDEASERTVYLRNATDERREVTLHWFDGGDRTTERHALAPGEASRTSLASRTRRSTAECHLDGGESAVLTVSPADPRPPVLALSGDAVVVVP